MRRLTIASVLVLCALVFGWVYMRERTIDRGRQAFARYGCASCHYAGGAPNLQNVARRYDRETLERFLRDPEEVYKNREGRPLNKNFGRMPKMALGSEDIPALVAYLQELSD